MSDSISAYYDDVEQYEALCKYYKETPVVGVTGRPDPYCPHAHKLEKRNIKDTTGK